MSYDIHGLWDQASIWTGPYLKGHTNITEIDDALDLLWRNGIPSKKVNMGFGFYGRSFTMSDPKCRDPGCTFSGAGAAGPCSNAEGILTYSGSHYT
jgi:GH18 family chitinase